jgi:hypothetical protein
MADQKQNSPRLLVLLRSLFPTNWLGTAGERFRKVTEEIAEFSSGQGIHPSPNETIDLVRTKLEGNARRDLAAAVKDFAEAEQHKIESEFKRRALSAELSRKEAEARLAQIRRIEAELELLTKLRECGVVLTRDQEGNLTISPAPANYDYEALANRLKEEDLSR